MITFNCPQCGQELDCDESLQGEISTCPKCTSEFTIPFPNTTRPTVHAAPILHSSGKKSCSHCGGADVKKVSLIYESNMKSFTAGGLSLGSDGGVGVMGGSFNIGNLLSNRIAPPAKPSRMAAVVFAALSIFTIVIGYEIATSSDLIGMRSAKPGFELIPFLFFLVVSLSFAGISLGAYFGYKKDLRKFFQQIQRWQQQWICLSCGQVWQE